MNTAAEYLKESFEVNLRRIIDLLDQRNLPPNNKFCPKSDGLMKETKMFSQHTFS